MENLILILQVIVIVGFISYIFYSDGKLKGEKKNEKYDIAHDGLEKFVGVLKKRD